MQLDEQQPQLPYTLTGPPPLEKLLPPAAAALLKSPSQRQKGSGLYLELLPHLRSPLQAAREAAPIEAPQQLQQPGVTLSPASMQELLTPQQQQLAQQLFPRTAGSKGGTFVVGSGATPLKAKVGLVLVGEATPGLANVALGIIEKSGTPKSQEIILGSLSCCCRLQLMLVLLSSVAAAAVGRNEKKL